jgi:hypothetical protein
MSIMYVRRVSVSDTSKPHGGLFSGMPGYHPGAGFRKRRATGGSLSPPSGTGPFSPR